MEKLIKSLMNQLKLVKKVLRETDETPKESSNYSREQIKTDSQGQWAILEKAVWENAPHIHPNQCTCGGAAGGDPNKHHYSCVDKNPPPPSIEAHNGHLTTLFQQMNGAAKVGDQAGVDLHKGKIKDYVLKTPAGGIDLGHLGKLRETSEKHVADNKRPMTHDDMSEMINHHAGNAKDLQDIYHKHGGEGAIETLMRTIGANGTPAQYSNLKFKDPKVHEELEGLVHGNAGISTASPLGAANLIDPKLQSDVDKTYDEMYETGDGDEVKAKKDHENAVVKRSMDVFKK